jgi:hypothetical protein
MPTSILLRADQVIEEACLLQRMSLFDGTFETCRAGLAMSVDWGGPEVAGGASKQRE